MVKKKVQQSLVGGGGGGGGLEWGDDSGHAKMEEEHGWSQDCLAGAHLYFFG